MKYKRGKNPNSHLPQCGFQKGHCPGLGKNSPTWKGGRHKNNGGYIYILKPDHPFSDKNGYITEHRLIVEKQRGCYLLFKEVIHHINGIKDDNRIENLMVFKSIGYHSAFHRLGYYNPKYIIFDGRNRSLIGNVELEVK